MNSLIVFLGARGHYSVLQVICSLIKLLKSNTKTVIIKLVFEFQIVVFHQFL